MKNSTKEKIVKWVKKAIHYNEVSFPLIIKEERKIKELFVEYKVWKESTEFDLYEQFRKNELSGGRTFVSDELRNSICKYFLMETIDIIGKNYISFNITKATDDVSVTVKLMVIEPL